MNDGHVVAITAIIQCLLLFANAFLVFRYLVETRKLRKAAEDQVTKSQSQTSAAYDQVEAMRHQTAVAQAQLEAQIRPALTVTVLNGYLCVTSVGNGPALNLHIVKGRSQTVFSSTAKVETNFGKSLEGACIATGEPPKSMNEVFGAVGQLEGEDLQLVYESLSAKRYISMVKFDGPGNPRKTTLYVPGE